MSEEEIVCISCLQSPNSTTFNSAVKGILKKKDNLRTIAIKRFREKHPKHIILIRHINIERTKKERELHSLITNNN